MIITSSQSLIFQGKSTGSDLAFILGKLRKSSDFFGRLRTSSGIFGNDRVVFKTSGTARIKISRLYLRKSWQVYICRKVCRPTLSKSAPHRLVWVYRERCVHILYPSTVFVLIFHRINFSPSAITPGNVLISKIFAHAY